ncbi:hypothetical protein [Butyrivibrio sp. ob235]|uniref:hypothetical protein n=1 Tax=Butyrivibrio sp. ob235 TaxID=1761780 RepID=UPI001A9A3511|nr:hypothetical protein [Butyrivibrio sp. ob235]
MPLCGITETSSDAESVEVVHVFRWGEEGKSISDMMEEADAKLYYGKRNGKNQVVSEL